MGHAVDRIGRVVIDAGVATAALLGVVALAMIACRQPARRLALARAGLVASLATIPLAVDPPLGRVDIIRPAVRLAAIETSPQGLRAGPIAPARTWRWRSATRAATLVYGGGVAVGVAWLGLGWWGMGRLRRGATGPSPEALALYRSLGNRAPPRLMVSSRISRPVLTGGFRPTILIPPAMDAPEAAERLRLVLLHELAHADRRDPWFALLGGLAQAIWYVVPPLWWVRAQMRLDQEFLADRAASRGFDAAGSYAASLLDLASARSAGEVGPTQAGPTQAPRGATSLVPRVMMLVRCPFPVESRPPAWWRPAVALAVAAGAVAASAIGVADPPGAAGVGPAPGAARVFTAAKLVLGPRPADARGRASAYEWPLALPGRFVLTASVWSDVARLASIRLAGLPIGPPAAAPAPADSTATWHRVRLVRDGSSARVWVDDHPVAAPATVDGPADEYLTVEPPPGMTLRLRDLRVSW